MFKATLPPYFKGIALFTPGGDLVYAIDASKQEQWHLHLCLALQDQLQLSEPPHFLVPCFTATVDRWRDDQTGIVQVAAEAKPALKRYQPILNAIFGLEPGNWQILDWEEQWCAPQVLTTYRHQFPQLWQHHDLVLHVTRHHTPHPASPLPRSTKAPPIRSHYTLRLYVAGISPTTEKTLKALHECLETAIKLPYTLEVVDIFRHPEKAEMDQITATPTLIKVWPKPTRRIVGELDPVEKILPFLYNSIEET